MKIATFLLTESEVVPFANNAKFIELTEAYDIAYAAVAAIRKSEEDEIAEMMGMLEPSSEEREVRLAPHALQGELSHFLAYSVFEDRRRAKAELNEIDASQEDVEATIDELDDDAHDEGKIYDYGNLASCFKTIKDFKDRDELRRSASFFKEAIDAYEEGNIFDLAEDDKSYDVRLAIDNFTNLYEDGGYFSPPSFDDPMSEDEKEAFFGEVP